MNLTKVEHSKTSRVLIFGAPKTGKTELVGRLAEQGFKLIWFDFENGYETLLKLPESAKQNINLIRIPDTRSMPMAIETALKIIKGTKSEICNVHGKVGCPKCGIDFKDDRANNFETIELSTLNDPKTVVVFDSLTQLTNSAIANITKGQSDEYKMQFDDWGNLGKLMDIFLSHIQQANYNVVCISHESEVEMEDDRKKIVPVSGTRNFSRNTAKYFDHVIYAEVKNKKHNFGSATDYAMNIVTGSRTDVKLEGMTKASLAPIFNHEIPASASVQTNTQGITSLNNIKGLVNKP